MPGSFLFLSLSASTDYRYAFRIQNPLHGIPKPKLMAQVEQFAREKGMEEQLPLLQKAALLAQNPKEFENIPELDEEDREVIRREITRMYLADHRMVLPAHTSI